MNPAVSLIIALYLLATPVCFADTDHIASTMPTIHSDMHMSADASTETPLAHHSGMYRTLSTALPLIVLVLCAFLLARVLVATSFFRVCISLTRLEPSPTESPPRSSLLLRLALFETAPPFAF